MKSIFKTLKPSRFCKTSKVWQNNYDVYLFDLDDTLYPEIAYLKAAFKAISIEFEEKNALNAGEIELFLTHTFLKEGRKNLFNKLFNYLLKDLNNLELNTSNTPKKHKNTDGGTTSRFLREGVLLEKTIVNICLNTLRTVKITEKIDLFPYVYALIPQLLAQNKQIFVVTNGTVVQQKNKIAALNWQNLDTSLTFVFAHLFAPKPSSKVFDDYLEPNFHLKNKKILFIGDAETDAAFSQNCGIDFLHVDFLK